MSNFIARTKDEIAGRVQAQPGSKVPQASFEHLRPLGATEFYPRYWQYLHEQHTLEDFRRPGYFAGDTRDHLRVGDTITYTLQGGEKLPSRWQRGVAIVEDVPNSRELPVILAGLVQYEQSTVWRKIEKAKAA